MFYNYAYKIVKVANLDEFNIVGRIITPSPPQKLY